MQMRIPAAGPLVLAIVIALSGTIGAASAQQPQKEPIYGSRLMSPQERLEHRERMRNAATAEEREQVRLEHHQAMQARAKARGITLPDKPRAGAGPMGPGTGSGGGMGPGSGMGPGGGARGPRH